MTYRFGSCARASLVNYSAHAANGADAALSFIKDRGVSDRRAQLIWDLVALNSTPSIALHKEAEVRVGTMGIGLDYGGFGIESIPPADVAEILTAFPRLNSKGQVCRDLPSARRRQA